MITRIAHKNINAGDDIVITLTPEEMDMIYRERKQFYDKKEAEAQYSAFLTTNQVYPFEVQPELTDEDFADLADKYQSGGGHYAVLIAREVRARAENTYRRALQDLFLSDPKSVDMQDFSAFLRNPSAHVLLTWEYKNAVSRRLSEMTINELREACYRFVWKDRIMPATVVNW